PACRPPSPAAQGKGRPLARRSETRAFASPVHGGSSPEGGEGGALDLALPPQDQDQKPPPSGLSATFPRCAGEGTAVVASNWNSLSLPLRSGGSSPEGGEGGALDLALNHQDQDQKPAPSGLSATFP